MRPLRRRADGRERPRALHPRGLRARVPDPGGRQRGRRTRCRRTTSRRPAAGVRWNDPAFGIAWPVADADPHPRDARYPDFVPERRRVTRALPAARPARGEAMHALVAELYPICRSITGRRPARDAAPAPAARAARAARGAERHPGPRLDGAEGVEHPRRLGRRRAGRAGHRLPAPQPPRPQLQRAGAAPHDLAELRPHLYTLPEQPDWIPYRTSYYAEAWGFCLRSRAWTPARGRVRGVHRRDPRAGPPHLRRVFLPGRDAGRDPVLLPHLPSVAGQRQPVGHGGRRLARPGSSPRSPRRHGMRFLFIPGTIGSITWLAAQRGSGRAGSGTAWSLSCLGDAGRSTYKRSRRGDAARGPRRGRTCCGTRGRRTRSLDFVPYGYDERQYCSPGFDLPVGCLTRTPNGRFPEYHTSADNLGFVRAAALEDSLAKALAHRRGARARRARYRQPEPQGRAAARAARPVRQHGRARRRRASRWRCCGC